jgi:hypothetical protein
MHHDNADFFEVVSTILLRYMLGNDGLYSGE